MRPLYAPLLAARPSRMRRHWSTGIVRPLYAPLLVALSFLTLLPVGIADATDREISRSRAWYPLVGLLYGAMLVGIAALGDLLALRPPLTAALLVAALAVANRFLHLDGLMDVCDGVWGGRTAERRLEIMRDSRVGAFAVAGAGCVLLLKYGALVTLLDGKDAGIVGVWPALLLFPVVARWTMTLLLTAFPYGRRQGIGASFAAAGRPWLATGWAFLTAVLFAAAGGIAGITILAGVSLLALLLGLALSRRLGGGLTGDCYGAANELAETAALIALAASVANGWGWAGEWYPPL